MPTLTDSQPNAKDKDKKFTIEKLRTKANHDLIVGDYLDARMKKFLGHDVDDTSVINIPEKYNNDEGTTKGFEKAKGWVEGLRIDLQKAQVHNHHTYACWQVQWGKGGAGDPTSKSGGAFCGALMRVATNFTLKDLRDALKNSWNTRTYWFIDP